ncbi:MAG: CDP-alcohol phosphatidyltransferase family protein [Allosphingosinicella sp.]
MDLTDELVRDSTAPAAARAPTRPPELEDWLNLRIYHPLSARIAAALESTPVSPNMVSFTGGTLIVLAGLFYVGLDWPVSVALGFVAHATWHVVDGADGDLARRRGVASPMGELIDGACDYVGHFLLYCLLAIPLYRWIGPLALAAGLAAGLCRIVQSNHSESRRRTYQWRVYGIPWLKEAQASTSEARGWASRTLRRVGQIYVAAAANPLAERVDALVAAAPDREAARALCRRRSRTALRFQTWLGPNSRTVALALSMAAGSPLWFFLYEIVGMNLLLVAAAWLQRRCDRDLAERLVRCSPAKAGAQT